MRNWAGVGRNGVKVLIRCPGRAKQQGGTCLFRLTALDKRSGPAASKRRVVKLRAKRKREISLPISPPRYRGRLDSRPTVLVRYEVKVGTVRTRVYKQLRVVSCSNTPKC